MNTLRWDKWINEYLYTLGWDKWITVYSRMR